MNKKNKICYITGTRADYGLMNSTLRELDKYFDLSLIVVGMHLSEKFGMTVRDIEKDGFKIEGRIKSLSEKDSSEGMLEALSLNIAGLTNIIASLKPDWLLLLGDRGEVLAGSIVGAHLNIPVVHIHGGDQGDDAAHIDDLVRHAVTKFSHIHFVATKESAQRLLKMGEEKGRVHMVGSPAIDAILSEKLYSKNYIEKKYNLDLEKPFVLVVQHSTPSQEKEAEQQITETLEALKEINEQTVLIYPNSDAGGRKMIEIIGKYEKFSFLKTFKSLPRKDYLSVMKYAVVMVGNSSSGTIDTPMFKIPVVNVGTREALREHAGNKIFVGHNRKEITKAIQKAMLDEKFRKDIQECKNPYGDGKAGKRIVNILKKIKIDKNLLEKRY